MESRPCGFLLQQLGSLPLVPTGIDVQVSVGSLLSFPEVKLLDCTLNLCLDPFVVHEHDDWVFTLLRDMCLPPKLVMTSAHYLSDVKKKKDHQRKGTRFYDVCFAVCGLYFSFPS